MGTLQAALEWARRGFPVFPLRENGKEPIHEAWPTVATTDEGVIRRMWTDPVLGTERNYNIGSLCSNMVVVDIDVKEGKNGYTEYDALGGHYDTLVVRTPTGGFHCYFNGPDSSNSSISSSIDIRSHNGFVVAPGSRIQGYGTETYEVINERPMVRIPDCIGSMLTAPYVRAADFDIELDSPAAIEAGIRFLQSTAPAIEGQRGDEVTFKTAARLVRELGLSPQTAYLIMRDHWNQRCSPPWDLDELWRKVENATAYGTAGAGKLTAEALYGHLDIPKVPPLFHSAWGNGIIPDSIRPRPWLVERMLMLEAVTVLMAAGSAGKSSVSLALAAHLALGLDFAGFKTRRACKTIVYNGEDDVEEQSRRLMAVCMAYNFDYAEVKKSIMLLSSQQIRMDLVAQERGKPIRNDALVQHLINEASDFDVGCLVLDPLVKIHKCDESDNVQMDYVMETLTDIARAAKVSVFALHHTSKGNGRTEDRIGNMDIGRGASAIINAARVGFTLLGATAQDAEDYGLQDDERAKWVRMDDAKMNLALTSGQATWFFKEGMKIPSGDYVGVLKHDVLEKSKEHIKVRVARLLMDTMTATGAGSITMPRVCSVVKASVPMWSIKTDAEIKRRIEGLFHITYELDGRSLTVERDQSDKKGEKLMLVMR